MKKLLFLFIPLFLFLIGSVMATTDISTCIYLNVSGTYRLSADYTTNATYCGSEASCIYINASDVILDLNSKQLIDGGGCQYGIHVLAKDPNPLIQWTGLVIKNGNVSQFNNVQIRVQGSTNGMYLYGLYLIGTNSVGIYAEGLNSGIQIQTNYIDTGSDYSIFLSGYSGWNTIEYNSLYSWDGIYLGGLNFIVEGNWIGNYYDNNQIKQYTSNTSCIKYETPTDYAITLDTVYNASIRKNRILSNSPITLHDAENINITQNEWLKIPNGEYVTTIDSGSSKVNFNENIFTESINSGTFYYSDFFGNIVYSYCYWSKNSRNVYDLVLNEGTDNNITEHGTSCIIGYSCINSTKVFLDSDCSIIETYDCEYGCQEGTCIGTQSVTTTTSTSSTTVASTTIPLSYNKTSMYDPIIDRTDLDDVELGWAVPFLTPFFLVLTGVMVGSAVITGITKSIVVFPIMVIVFMLIFAFFGIIDWWMSGVVVLFGVLGAATLLKQHIAG